jgi:hypothetical protein
VPGSNTEFEKELAEEIRRYSENAVPVKASLLERWLVTKLPVRKIHPNPADEFCDPKIGPSYEIISNYVEKFSHSGGRLISSSDEPLMVEKIRPQGYMLLNGHHRWAAAKRLGISKLPVKILNLTQMTDIMDLIRKSDNDKRVTFDLDEVVFAAPGEEAEKGLRFPFNRFYKEPLRYGIPALFHFLNQEGYDIWIYSRNYYPEDYIRSYFMRYHVLVHGIVAGTPRKRLGALERQKEMEKLFSSHYSSTVHVDAHSVVRSSSKEKFEDYSLGSSLPWYQEVIDVIKKIEQVES